jgi:molecular chaperone GrpE
MFGKKEEETNPPETAEASEPKPSPEAEQREQLLRLKAEFENTKKRLERDKQDAIRFANEKLLADMLHIVDTFDRAMASLAEGHDPAKVRKGLEIANDELHKILERYGVQPVKSVGQPFDPNLHEAVAEVEVPGQKSGTVVDEVQRGYVLNGRLIRPSRVRIARTKDE